MVRIIAEPGSCAEGQIDKFFELIKAAAFAGCTDFKAQWVSSVQRLCERRRAPTYASAYERIAYPPHWHADLGRWCREMGLGYGCSVYIPEDVETVAPYVDFLKIASFEFNDLLLIELAVQTGKPVFVSTGMQRLPTATLLRSDVSYLHCVSSYPTPLDQANLGACAVSLFAGYSDHTRHVRTGAYALMAGAKVLEVHLRLDDTDPANPDYTTALTPAQLFEYVDLVREAEVMYGSGRKEPQPAETAMSAYRARGA